MADKESAFQFQTHWNYVTAFANLAVPDRSMQLEEIKEMLYGQVDESIRSLPPRLTGKSIDPQIGISLRAALATEELLWKQLELCEQSIDLSRSVATWAAIQSYYGCYHAFQTLLIASGQPRPESHSSTQKHYASLWLNNKCRIRPWSLGFKNGEAINYDQPIHKVSNISTFKIENALALVDKSLRTTWNLLFEDALFAERNRLHKSREKSWKSEHGHQTNGKTKLPPWGRSKSTRLNSGHRATVAANSNPATLLHYLYRLRISANYVESAAFLDGPQLDFDAIDFIRNLTVLTSATIRVHERRVAHQIGLQEFDNQIKRHRN